MTKINDLTNRRFGKYLVLSRAKNDKHGSARWDCICDCGSERIVYGSSLNIGKTKSCGCISAEKLLEASTTHGLSDTPIHWIWQKMRARCADKNDCRYGGRGISVCVRWNSFENFLADMGDRPSPKHTIDRIDNDGDYTPKNCRWATRRQQANNRKSNRYITYNKQILTYVQWSRRLGGCAGLVQSRIYRGWTEAAAVSTLVLTRRGKARSLTAEVHHR